MRRASGDSARKSPVCGGVAAVMRSVRLYHGPQAPKAAMDALYACFVRCGDLVFDVGAHVGDRVASFRRLGARVVALEPQPGPMRAMRLICGRDPNVTLLPMAAGPVTGRLSLHVNSANPTVTSASAAFLAAADGAAGWEGQVWDRMIEVEATTLDALIERYGAPAFVKIDVEGFEDRILAGLSRQIPALSFEFTTIERPVARDCMARLAQLGAWRFNAALGETQRLVFEENVEAHTLLAWLDGLPHSANSGDVYAIAV